MAHLARAALCQRLAMGGNSLVRGFVLFYVHGFLWSYRKDAARHAHHGQVWPASWITDALYEKAYGGLKKGNTLYYVSSGIGIWGGKFRIGTQSEYVVLTVSR